METTESETDLSDGSTNASIGGGYYEWRNGGKNERTNKRVKELVNERVDK